MNIERCEMPSFSVIGREGSTDEGAGFVQRLWSGANEHFCEIADIVARDENGRPLGFWGAMSDMGRRLMPWEDGLSRGLYLAGAQVENDAQAPDGWVKWTIPAYECLYVEMEDEHTLSDMLDYMRREGLSLVGAINDFTCPETGKNYMFFPIRKM